MNSSSVIPTLMTQMASQSPVLIVYVLGIVLALIFWRRCPTSCVFTLIAMAILLLTTVAQTFLNIYVVQLRASQGWTSAQVGTFFTINALVGGVLRAAAMGLLLAAVFMGRPSPLGAGFPVQPLR